MLGSRWLSEAARADATRRQSPGASRHRPGARYSARLQQLGVPIGQCPLCCSAGPIHEIVQDPEHGDVHVHRDRLGTTQLSHTHRG